MVESSGAIFETKVLMSIRLEDKKCFGLCFENFDKFC